MPNNVLMGFYSQMQDVCVEHKPSLNVIHISTIITASAQLWEAAQQNPRFTRPHPQAHCDLVTFLRDIFCLQPLPKKVGPRAISNICWSSAKVGVHPDTFVPGIMDSLTANFVDSVQAQSARHRPNAQDLSNFIWGCAVLKHTPSDAAMTSISRCFVESMEAQVVKDRPNAQNISNLVWSYAVLKHVPSDAAMSSLLRYFVSLCGGRDPGHRPVPQNISNVLYACAELGIKCQTRYG